MSRTLPIAAVAVVALGAGATGAVPAAATSSGIVAAHKLVVAVRKNLPPAAERRLAVLVLVGRGTGAPAGAVATASKPLTVLLADRGLYHVTAEIDSACDGACAATYHVSGSADHKLVVVPSCRSHGPGFVCSTVRILRAY